MTPDEARAVNGVLRAANKMRNSPGRPISGDWAVLWAAVESYRAAGSPEVPDGMSIKTLRCPKCSVEMAVMGACPCDPSGFGDKVFCAESLMPVPDAEALMWATVVLYEKMSDLYGAADSRCKGMADSIAIVYDYLRAMKGDKP